MCCVRSPCLSNIIFGVNCASPARCFLVRYWALGPKFPKKGVHSYTLLVDKVRSSSDMSFGVGSPGAMNCVSRGRKDPHGENSSTMLHG
jgi:hypothetical protein